MSGNPFRKSQGSRLPSDPSPSDQRNDPTVSTPSNTQNKRKKRVVIQTPPHSPEARSIPRSSSDGRSGSPPPPAQFADDDTDSTAMVESDLEQTSLESKQNSVTAASFAAAPARVPSETRAPYNPFARTLATSEARFGFQQREENSALHAEREEPGQRQSAGRLALDVDAFTNILLAGQPPPSTAAQEQRTGRQENNSSSTDTSSSSRQSIFDQMNEFHPESPRSSFDGYHHAEDDDDDDNEHSSLMGPIESRPVAEGPPAPPKPQYARTFPQTVPFADFEDRVSPSNLHLRLQTSLTDGQALGRPLTPRSPSDLNKPLPPPPSESASISAAAADTSSKKAPPPPPPASRRRAQADQTGGRARSGSSLSANSVQSASRSTKPGPTPPPPRNPPTTSGLSSPLVATPPQQLPLSQPSNTETRQAPPAPPPRRAGGAMSKRSSLDTNTLSKSDHRQQTSQDQEIETPSNAPKEPQSDILADLEAFQAEIDALRAQALRNG